MRFSTDLDRLRQHLPAAAYPAVLSWLRRNPVLVRVSAPRATKLGDFRSATRSLPHRVSVNADLNKYAFLVTLVHEFAHYSTHAKTRRWTRPHGPIWKEEYWRLMRPFMSREVFPADVLHALEHHLHDAPASSCTDHDLMRMLRRYVRDTRPYLAELADQTVCRFNHRLFVKGPQLRKRYKCRCLNDRRTYFIDPLAEVHVEQPVPTRRAS